MSEHNVLYILEGSAENRFLKRLWDRFGFRNKYSVFEFKTNIHVLMDLLYEDGMLDTNLDLLRVLRSSLSDEEGVLSRRYEYVYMIFDLDPQDAKTDMARISEMIDHFNDPADNGRLYINYPMLESYRHLKSMDDDGYFDRCVSVPLLKEISYKQIVNDECCNELKQLNNYDTEIYRMIIMMNLRKENYLLTGNKDLMSKERFLNLSGSEVLRKEWEFIDVQGVVSVLNTCVFIVVENRPSLFFD